MMDAAYILDARARWAENRRTGASNHYDLRYISQKDGKEKCHRIIGEEKKNENLRICKEKGIRVISCKKLYPINMERNQHNFELIMNCCFCEMADMRDDTKPFDQKEYDELQKRHDRAAYFWNCYGDYNSKVSWFTFEEWEEAKELIAGAEHHRMAACEEHGVPYVSY